VALETGTHSPWLSRLLKELGHEVLVAHAQKVELIIKSNRKDDRHDARTLTRLARIDPELLGPVRHRSAKAQIHLTVIRARAALVSARTALVNAARGLVKSYGERLPKCGTEQVSRELATELSAELREILEPLLKEIVDRAHQGIRRADGENRQGELPASRAAQTGEGSGNTDRADVCPDSRRPASVRKESRGRLFSRVKTWAHNPGKHP
jgi:transposase